MPNVRNLPEVTDLTALARSADESRNDFRTQLWDLRRQYTGLSTLADTTINKLYMTERNIEAVLASERLETTLTSEDPMQALRARISTVTLNHHLSEADAVWERNRMLLRARIDGISFLHAHWLMPFTPSVKEVDGALEAEAGGHGMSRQRPNEEAIRESLSTVFTHEFVGRERVWVEGVNALDVLTAPGIRGWRNPPWVIRRHWMTRGEVEELQSSGFFAKGQVKYDPSVLPSGAEQIPVLEGQPIERGSRSQVGSFGTVPHTGARAAPKDPNRKETTNPDQLVEVLEFVWRSKRQILTFIPGMDTYLRVKDYTLPSQRPQLVPMLFTDDTLSPWPKPDAAQYLGLQKVHNQLVRAIVSAAQRAKNLIGYDPGAVQDEAIFDAAARAMPNTFIPITPNGMQQFTIGAMPPQAFDVLALMDQGILQLGGGNQALTGIPSQPGVSATESNNLQSGFNGRMRHAARFVTRTDTQLAKRVFTLLQAFLPAESLVPLVGEDAMEWELMQGELFNTNASVVTGNGQSALRLNRKSLEGDFKFAITVGAASEVQNALEKREIQHAWNLTAPFLMNPQAMANPAVRNLLTIFYERHGIDAQHVLGAQQPQPPMMAPPQQAGPAGVGRGPAGGASVGVSGDFQQRTGLPGANGNSGAGDLFRG